jgi:hypothetical protein
VLFLLGGTGPRAGEGQEFVHRPLVVGVGTVLDGEDAAVTGDQEIRRKTVAAAVREGSATTAKGGSATWGRRSSAGK